MVQVASNVEGKSFVLGGFVYANRLTLPFSGMIWWFVDDVYVLHRLKVVDRLLVEANPLPRCPALDEKYY